MMSVFPRLSPRKLKYFDLLCTMEVQLLLDYTGPLFPPFVSPLLSQAPEQTTCSLLLAACFVSSREGEKGRTEGKASTPRDEQSRQQDLDDWLHSFHSARCSTIGGTSSVRPHEPFVRLARSISRSVRSASRNGIGLGKKIGLLNSDGIVLHTV